jgi:hypothetical protein
MKMLNYLSITEVNASKLIRHWGFCLKHQKIENIISLNCHQNGEMFASIRKFDWNWKIKWSYEIWKLWCFRNMFERIKHFATFEVFESDFCPADLFLCMMNRNVYLAYWIIKSKIKLYLDQEQTYLVYCSSF